jgi:Fe2+ transport system protein FeoA
MTLEDLPFDREARIASISMSSEIAAYLRAVGIGEGTRVSVVRAAPFGGPLFLRASSGAEVAIDREIARAIVVES